MSNTTPRRFQCESSDLLKLPKNTIYVAGDGRWGNPYRVTKRGDKWTITEPTGERRFSLNREEAARLAVKWFGEAIANGWDGIPMVEEIRSGLRGKNLACFCGLDKPCHADVYLEIANADIQEAA